MQTYRPDIAEMPEIDPDYFVADSKDKMTNLMDNAADLKKMQGYSVNQRVKIGRNDPCPCRSGKKFKKCCINKAKR